MPKLKVLSGFDVVKILEIFGFTVAGQKGSHIKLARTSAEGLREILTIPRHKELDKGTLKAIIRQISRYVPQDQLQIHFYND
jgi:predicted RNA binding protein YcfA (HicA-like mRNA interferase family)